MGARYQHATLLLDQLDLDASILRPELGVLPRFVFADARGLHARDSDAVRDEVVLNALGALQTKLVVVGRRTARVGVTDQRIFGGWTGFVSPTSGLFGSGS